MIEIGLFIKINNNIINKFKFSFKRKFWQCPKNKDHFCEPFKNNREKYCCVCGEKLVKNNGEFSYKGFEALKTYVNNINYEVNLYETKDNSFVCLGGIEHESSYGSARFFIGWDTLLTDFSEEELNKLLEDEKVKKVVSSIANKFKNNTSIVLGVIHN
jgi:hypothetical protein